MNFFACFYLTVPFIAQGQHLVLSENLILFSVSARRNDGKRTCVWFPRACIHAKNGSHLNSWFLTSPNCSCIMTKASQKYGDVKKSIQKKNPIQGLVSLSPVSKPFKHLFSMIMKSKNLYKSWDSPGNHYSKIWGSAEISRLLMKSWELDSPFSCTQASIWTAWGWCEDECESKTPPYIPFP